MLSLRPRMKTMIPFWMKIVHQDTQEVSLQIFRLYITINRFMYVVVLIILVNIKYYDPRLVAQWMWNRESEWHQFEYPTKHECCCPLQWDCMVPILCKYIGPWSKFRS